MRAKLERKVTGAEGTFGVLSTEHFACRSLELPSKDNRPNLSCIPAGEYECQWIVSRRFGPSYWVKDVPGRSGILIHPGNLAGDTELGLKTHSYGCILLGEKVGALSSQSAVLSSRPAVRKFSDAMRRKPFTLEVVDA